MSSHGYVSALERERDELERRYRQARRVSFVLAGYAAGLSAVIVVVWALVMFGGGLS